LTWLFKFVLSLNASCLLVTIPFNCFKSNDVMAFEFCCVDEHWQEVEGGH
jgi:hypothetical protein